VAVFYDRHGGVYLNPILGLPGSEASRVAFDIGADGYARLSRFYAVAATALLLTLAAAALIPFFPSRLQPAVALSLALANAAVAVAAAIVTRGFPPATIDLSHCTGESRLSNLIYISGVTIFFTQAVIFFHRHIFVLTAFFVALGALPVLRMAKWTSIIRRQRPSTVR
jgi:hypothetical protein